MIIDKVIEKYVPRKKQTVLLFLTSLQWMLAAAGVMVMSLTLPSVIEDLPSSALIKGSLASSVFVGMLFGALISGFLSDWFGRKYTNIIFLLIAGSFSMMTGLANTGEQFALFRLLSGFGYGGLLPVVNAYLTEFTSIKIRGRYLTYLESSWAIGSILLGLFSVLTLDSFGWRPSYFALAIFCIPLLIIAFTLPKSPKYAFLKGGKPALEKALKLKIAEDIEMHPPVKIPFIELLKNTYRSRTLMIWFAWFSISFTYYGIFTWAPKIFASRGIEHTSALWYTFFMLLMQLPGYLLAAFLIERIGRKKTAIFFFTGTGLAVLLLFIVHSSFTALLFAVILSVFCMGAWGFVYAYTPELFPTEMRALGNGSSQVMARISGIIAPYYATFLIETGGYTTVVMTVTLAFFMLTGAFFFAKNAVETKGKAIE
ncbi:MAG TPA: MFS transporter [Thermotogota bacterium]|nr:MFS transporter [Thermotogota bacterium]HRW34962.1 MFS transporter [Thermotogota bacterium]